MSDLINRKTAVQGVKELFSMGDCYCDELSIIGMLNSLPSQPKWILATEVLPEDKDWYLGIFKESDTGYCISVPFVCYYAGRKTMITTKDYWILRGYDDIYSFSEYYRNLECAAWMPLPEPYGSD